MKKINYVYVCLALAAIFAVYWFFFRKPKQEDEATQASAAGNTAAAGVNATQAAGLDMYKTLKVGVSGKEVKELQKLLNAATPIAPSVHQNLTVDGIFGTNTKNQLYAKMRKYEVSLLEAAGTLNPASSGSSWPFPTPFAFASNDAPPIVNPPSLLGSAELQRQTDVLPVL